MKGQASWHFNGASKVGHSIYALTNAGTHYRPEAVARLAAQLASYLKSENIYKPGFQLFLLAALYRTEEMFGVDTWGYYPSSTPQKDSDELMAKICKLVREPLKRQYAKAGEPLLIRHKPSSKRSYGSTDRTDPMEQLQTLHLNPACRSYIENKHVAIVDDFVTYGLSFGVAAALLRKAGAKQVSCIAMGKFGQCIQDFDIEIAGDPYAALRSEEWSLKSTSSLVGACASDTELELVEKFGERLR